MLRWGGWGSGERSERAGRSAHKEVAPPPSGGEGGWWAGEEEWQRAGEGRGVVGRGWVGQLVEAEGGFSGGAVRSVRLRAALVERGVLALADLAPARVWLASHWPEGAPHAPHALLESLDALGVAENGRLRWREENPLV